MEKDMERYRAARRAFEGMAVKHPGPLDPALKKIGLECKIKEIANPPRCVPGWVIRQKDIDFSENEVPLSRVMQWVREIESQDTKGPPWRLARCSIRSSSRAPGSGQVVLLFEALEQTDAPPALVTPP
jgi:hypothetical protein